MTGEKRKDKAQEKKGLLLRVILIAVLVPGLLAGTVICLSVFGSKKAEAEREETRRRETAALAPERAGNGTTSSSQTSPETGEGAEEAAGEGTTGGGEKYPVPDYNTVMAWVRDHEKDFSEEEVMTASDNEAFAAFLYRWKKGLYTTIPSGEISLSTEEKIADVPLFEQWDDRWGYTPYGKEVIGTSGCGPTCMAMVASGLLSDERINPAVVADFSTAHHLYQKGVGTRWSVFSQYSASVGITCTDLKKNKEQIPAELKAHHPVICSMKKGNFTYGGHFIVLTSIDDEGLITLNDPMSQGRSRLRWKLSDFSDQIKNSWSFSR